MTEQHAAQGRGDRKVVGLLALLIAGYVAATAAGWTRMAPHRGHAGPKQAALATAEMPAAGRPHPTPLWLMLPFALLLGAIAVLPLMDPTAHWWESNLHKFYVAANLALVTLLGIALVHPTAGLARAESTLVHTVVDEYIPFIVLLFSLYTICGGIRIAADLPAHSWTNTKFMLAGGLLASLIGTTGAAMLLIRPLVETNRERRHVAHTIVFFIFVVCNCGGLLLPLGDPPLFLGYLAGVEFLWTLRLWKSWLLINGLLLAVYFAWDHFYCYRREATCDLVRNEAHTHRVWFSGLWPNGLLLLGIVLSVALLDSSQMLPGTDWQPWFYLREAVQLSLVLASLLLGAHHVRLSNAFDYVAITEVAVLFIGVFVSMQPALEILKLRGGQLGLDTPAKYFWATGVLSSLLDNAPTYLVFFETAKAKTAAGWGAGGETMAGVATPLLAAISLGAVMMGAMTYIGNGPNFMVKTIAEKSGIKMPSFFGYTVYSCCVLLPILCLDRWLFGE
ncbi:MAG TPA: sodium:proton antiporter [Pirellulales bacterium]|jgi:Na+/H+ antiporter NhaD/arsenite permease-like protein|nr:sodium:proton antiporter [Pirellulales bacterium]